MSPQVEPRDVTPRWKQPLRRPKMREKTALWARSRAWAASRADGSCEARCHNECEGRGAQAHHIQRRSQGGSDGAENLLWVCHLCHQWIHDNPAVSFEKGWLRRG